MKETKTSLKPAQKELPPLVIIKPKELAASGKTGVVVKGILEKVEKDQFYPQNNNYFFRGEDGSYTLLKDSFSLKEQLAVPGVIGMNIEVRYLGTKKSKTPGKLPYHDFECFTIAS